jgi:hypothetical protein
MSVSARTKLLLLSTLLLAAGLINDAPWKGYRKNEHVSFISEPVRIADSLRRDRTFANPFGALRTGPTAHSAPGFPALLFVVLKVFGDQSGGWLAMRLLAALALSAQIALLPWAAIKLGYSLQTGVLAAIFGLITKPGLEERWEAHIAGLLGLLLTVCICRWGGSRTARISLLVGVIAGIAFLFHPVMLGVYVAWLLVSAKSARFLALWLVPVLLCGPWIVRNEVRLGGLFWMRDDLGMELSISFNDCTPYGFDQSLARFCVQKLHPNSSAEEAAAILSLGESTYNADRLRAALRWIGGHPLRASTLVAQRFWFFWFPSEDGWKGYVQQRGRALLLHLLTIASIAGLWFSWRQRTESALLLTLWLAIFPLIYCAVLFETRYRYPILWITWLEAAFFFKVAGARLGRRFAGRQP